MYHNIQHNINILTQLKSGKINSATLAKYNGWGDLKDFLQQPIAKKAIARLINQH